jgi:hypothetical protein
MDPTSWHNKCLTANSENDKWYHHKLKARPQMKEQHALKSFDWRRANERKPYEKEVVFSHFKTIYRGIVKNISLGGARIETGSVNRFSKGEIVTVSIPFSSGDRNIKRKGRIVWLNDTGFAIEFV